MPRNFWFDLYEGVSRIAGESQRDSATKPRVARDELPWVKWPVFHNPNGVAAWSRCRCRGRNPFRVVIDRTPDPRVARSSQPWALLRNPFGIRHKKDGAWYAPLVGRLKIATRTTC